MESNTTDDAMQRDQLLQQQQQQQQQQCVAIVLREWLTSTSLVQPRLQLCNFCLATTSSPLNDDNTKMLLKVEMYGSGVVLLPCFKFDGKTTTAELYSAVRNHLVRSDKGNRFSAPFTVRLLFQEQEITTDEQRLLKGTGITDGSIIFAIAGVDRAGALKKRECCLAAAATTCNTSSPQRPPHNVLPTR